MRAEPWVLFLTFIGAFSLGTLYGMGLMRLRARGYTGTCRKRKED